MKVLLDTHTLLWALAGDDRLSETAHDLIIDEANDVLVSVVSAWEVAVKASLGKLQAPGNLTEVISQAGFTERLVGFPDCSRLSSLPPIHRDPFDRMLVCQALEDGIPLITRDRQLAEYPIQTLW